MAFDIPPQNNKKIENIPAKAIDFIFKNNPELSEIGNKEQYSKYLETIFPESKIKSIAHHETDSDWFKTQKFNKEKMGKTDYGYYGKGFYFSTQRGLGGYGEHEFLSLLNIKNPKYDIDTHTVGKQILSGLDKNDSKEKSVSWIQEQIVHLENEIKDLKEGNIKKHNDIPKDIDFEIYWENKRLERIKIYSQLIDEYKNQLQDIDNLIEEYYSHDGFLTSNDTSNYEEIMLREPDNIHILGSKDDVKEFKEFLSK